MHRIGRRNAVIGTVAAAILAKLGTACDADAVAPAPLRIPTSEKSVHVNLASFAKLGPEKLGKARVHVAGGVYELTPHTDQSRRRFFASDARKGADVSHFAEQVRFSTIGVQSYKIGFHNEAGSFTKLFAGIHVPDEDPTHVADDDQRAVYAVYHNPVILTLDAETAVKVIGHIKAADGYTFLKQAINDAGDAVTPENAELGDTGWIKGVFSLDKAGAKIPRTSLKGAIVPGRYQYTWVLDDSVAAFARTVAEQAQRLIHSDATLEGKKYDTSAGVGVHTQPRGVRAGAQGDGDSFAFADQDVYRGRRALSVKKDDAGQLTLTVTNPNAVGTMLSMRALDLKGDPIGEAHQQLGYVAGTFYPGISRLFGPSKMAFPLKLPAGTASVDFLTSALALNWGDLEALKADPHGLAGAAVSDYTGNALFSGILDFFLPLTLLAAGAGGPLANSITLQLLGVMVKKVGIQLFVDIAKTIFIDLFALGNGELNVDTILAILPKVGVAILTAIPTILGKVGFAAIAVVIVEGLTEAVAEDAVEDAIPIVGWVLKLIEIGTALAQLAIEIVHVATGQAVIRSSLTPVHPLSVVLHPKAEQSAIFPIGASSYRVTVTPSARLPMESTGTFDPAPTSTTINYPQVPLYGTLTIEATLFDSANHVVGHGAVSIANESEMGKRQELDLYLDLFAAPLGPSSKLSHNERLDITTSSRKWTKTQARPTADDSALSCDPKAGKVCDVLGISASLVLGQVAYSFRTPMACGGGALKSQLHVGSLSDATRLNVTPCGSEGLSRILLGSRPDQRSLVIARTKEGPYGIFPFDPAGPIPTELLLASSAGELRGDTLIGVRRHADGYVIALTEVGVEAVHVESGRRRQPQIFARRGVRLGQISEGVAVAPLRGVRGYVLLEQAERRIQALDFEGNPLKVFGNGSAIKLPGDGGRSYLDVEVDHLGHLWVLSTVGNGSAPASFTVDVYDRSGTSIVSFDDVNARALAVDPLGTLYTLDCENAIGPGTYPEPVISRWTYV